MPFINVYHLWSWLKPLPKMVSYFWRLFWIFAPSHKYLHLGNLNPINILKCPNNPEGIFRLLRIFLNVPLNIFRFFLNGIVFLLFQNTEQKQIKSKTESRERGFYLALTWPGPARPSPLACASHRCPLASRTGRVPDARVRSARHASSLPACVPAALDASAHATQPPRPPLTLSRALPLLCSLSLSCPSAAVAAARRCRDHRLPLAPLTCPRAPP